MQSRGTSTTASDQFVESATFVCTLLNAAPIGMMVLREDWRCVAANATLWTLFRQSANISDLSPQNLKLFSETGQSGGVSNEVLEALRQSCAGQSLVLETGEPPVIGPGQGHWKLHFLPYSVAAERGVLVLFEDVTEQRATSEAFQAAEQRFRLLVDAAADGIVIYRSQILLYVNPEAVRLFGYLSPDELVGRPIGDLVDAEHRASFEGRLGDIEALRGPDVFETAFVRRGGDSFPVECRTTNARVDDMGAGFLFFRDIAERKRQQSRRDNARRVESLARLSGAVASDLQGFASRLRRLAARNGTQSEDMHALAEELLTLANDVAERASQFSLSRPSAPKDRDAAPIALEELMGRVCSQLVEPQRARFEGDGLAAVALTSTDVLVDLEPAEFAIRGDSAAIEQSLTVLAEAAWRSRANQTKLRIRGAKLSRIEHDAQPAYRLTIAGGDPKQQRHSGSGNGSTFPPTALPFRSWEQGRDLALLGAFSSLQTQGCWVEAQPLARGGLCFEVELSLDPNRSTTFGSLQSSSYAQGSTSQDWLGQSAHPTSSAIEEMSPDTERSLAGRALASARAEWPILICDDEARLVALTAGLLREFGFEVLTVRSGRDAIKAVAAHPVDVIVLDVNLPGEDAREIVTSLQSIREVFVVLSSGYTEEDVDPMLLQESAVKAFLSKPYTVDVLVQTIDRVRTEGKARRSSVDKPLSV